jgi:hypothetical protein
VELVDYNVVYHGDFSSFSVIAMGSRPQQPGEGRVAPFGH